MKLATNKEVEITNIITAEGFDFGRFCRIAEAIMRRIARRQQKLEGGIPTTASQKTLSERYQRTELDKVVISNFFNTKIKISGGAGGMTKWLSISNADFLKIKQILAKKY